MFAATRKEGTYARRGRRHMAVEPGSAAWESTWESWMATTTKQPAGEHDVSLLLQQQQQMAARLQQMEQMMELQRMAHEQQLMMIEGQRRAHELERLRMDLKLALGQADAVSKGGAVPSLRPSADFVRHCVAIQSAARGGERARFWLLQKRSAVKIQARARTWLVMGKLTDAYLAATRIAACARRRAAILKRKRLLEERAAARVQTAFRGYKSTVLDAPAVTKTRLIARMKRKGVAMRAAAEADKEVAVAAAVEAAMTAAWAVAEEQKAAAVRAAVAAAVSAERASRLAAARLQEATAARGAPPSAHDIAAMSVQETVAALRTWAQDVELAETCSAQLVQLTAVQSGAPQAAAVAGAIELVVATMEAHRHAERVQWQGCEALCNLAKACAGAEHAEGLARKQRAADAGAIEAVVAAMQAHRHAAVLQETGCRAVRLVTSGSDTVARARRQRAVNAGAIEAAVVAREAHPKVGGVQSASSAILDALA